MKFVSLLATTARRSTVALAGMALMSCFLVQRWLARWTWRRRSWTATSFLSSTIPIRDGLGAALSNMTIVSLHGGTAHAGRVRGNYAVYIVYRDECRRYCG